MNYDMLLSVEPHQINEKNADYQWFNIQLTPDLASGETLNIGVATINPSGHINTKMLDYFDRLECLFHKSFTDEVKFIIKIIEHELKSGNTSAIPVANVSYTPARYAAGNDENQVLNTLYKTTVTLASFPKEPQKREFRPASNEEIRAIIFNKIKQNIGLSASFLAQSPMYNIDDGNSSHQLDLPLQGFGLLGSIVSAVYKSTDRIEMNILRAIVDLDIAARIHPKDRLGLFVCKPKIDKNFTQDNANAIDNLFDQADWKAKKRGITFAADDNTGRLADNITEWAEKAAS